MTFVLVGGVKGRDLSVRQNKAVVMAVILLKKKDNPFELCGLGFADICVENAKFLGYQLQSGVDDYRRMDVYYVRDDICRKLQNFAVAVVCQAENEGSDICKAVARQ